MSRLGTARERHLAQSLSGRAGEARRLGISNVLFRPITLISLTLIGLFAFGALIVLSGFANDLRKLPPGQATPRSVSAVGYQALTDYLKRLDYEVEETRGKRPAHVRDEKLVIYTPSRATARLKKVLAAESEAVNLIILPKWSVRQMLPKRGEEKKTGWVRKTSETGLFYEGNYDVLMDNFPVVRRQDMPSPDALVHFNIPQAHNLSDSYQPDFKDLQYFDLQSRWPDYLDELREILRAEIEKRRKAEAESRGETYEPRKKKETKKSDSEGTEKEEAETPEPLPEHEILLTIDDLPVLIRLEATQTYVLSEPDLINTMAFQTQSGAQLAGAIIDDVISQAEVSARSVDFDVSLHGIESSRNIIKLMVTPPFLAASLCLLAAGGLVAWQGFNRFGDPERLRPDYAQGPVSLAKTAAEFMGIADRAHKTGEDYAALIRQQVVADLGYKDRSIDHIDTLLDAREKRRKITPVFADLKRAIANAEVQNYGQYARALSSWREAMTQSDFHPDAQQGPQNS